MRFCQATRLQYLSGHVQLANQNALQQQHVDHKIANALLKKGTRDTYKGTKRTGLGQNALACALACKGGGHPMWMDPRGRCPAARPAEQGSQRCLGSRQTWRWSYLQRRSVPADGVLGDSEVALFVRLVHEDLLQHYDCSDLQAAAQPPQLSGAAPAALLTKRTQPRILSTQAPRTTATANYFRSSTASTRHSSGVRFPPRRLPARTSPLGPGPFRRNAVSPSSSPRNCPSTRPSASVTRARVLKSSASSTAPRNARPHDKTPLSEWR